MSSLYLQLFTWYRDFELRAQAGTKECAREEKQRTPSPVSHNAYQIISYFSHLRKATKGEKRNLCTYYISWEDFFCLVYTGAS